MTFRDFITNRFFRKQAQAELEERSKPKDIKPPISPSPTHINELVARLLDINAVAAADEELSLIGAVATPALVAAMRDPRYQQEYERSNGSTFLPLGYVLGLLLDHAPDQAVPAAAPLIQSPSSEIRKSLASHLGSSGRDDAVPLLAQLLNDDDGFVRSYVQMGVMSALKDGRASDRFRREMYDIFLAQCDQEWKVAGNKAAFAVVTLDPERAAVDLASERWLTPSNRDVHRIIQACNQSRIRLPADRIRQLLDYSLARAVGNNCYPHQYIVAAALEALALSLGDQAKTLIESLLTSDQDEIQESAGRALVTLAGLDDPFNFVVERLQANGFASLTTPQRVVFFAHMFDAEVCNGGIMQFFGNSSGNQCAETLEALRILDLPDAVHCLERAMNLVGPLSRESDRDMRLSAFEDRYDELQAAFAPLESRYYATAGQLRQRILVFSAANAKHFR
jgi:HEAT repeat protein